MGLHDSYAQVRGHVLLQETMPSLSKVFSLVLQEKRQRKITSRLPFVSSSIGDINSTTTTLAVTKLKGSRPQCTHCNGIGHTIDGCYMIHGFPTGLKPRTSFSSGNSSGSGYRQIINDEWQQLISLLSSQSVQGCSSKTDPHVVISMGSFSGNMHILFNSNSKSQTIFNNSWVIDTSSTHHVCNNLSMFKCSSPVTNSSMTLPTGESICIDCIGYVHLSSTMTISNVLYIQKFHFNLISISALTSKQV